ncbi:MAG TPA: hypothetical protein VFM48_01225, partial [Aquabacterium sp.]|nr:hypothetical protein [Aquabacterium sp.]
MTTDVNRRTSFQWIFGMAVGFAIGPLRAQAASDDHANAWAVAASNFHGIYDDDGLRLRFRDFLRHVYSIYPSDQFHALISDVCTKQASDKDIYLTCQARLKEITPIANQVRNALPALLTQTEVVGRQIQTMMDGHGPIDGYLEMGTKGGYIGYARSHLDL